MKRNFVNCCSKTMKNFSTPASFWVSDKRWLTSITSYSTLLSKYNGSEFVNVTTRALKTDPRIRLIDWHVIVVSFYFFYFVNFNQRHGAKIKCKWKRVFQGPWWRHMLKFILVVWIKSRKDMNTFMYSPLFIPGGF